MLLHSNSSPQMLRLRGASSHRLTASSWLPSESSQLGSATSWLRSATSNSNLQFRIAFFIMLEIRACQALMKGRANGFGCAELAVWCGRVGLWLDEFGYWSGTSGKLVTRPWTMAPDSSAVWSHPIGHTQPNPRDAETLSKSPFEQLGRLCETSFIWSRDRSSVLRYAEVVGTSCQSRVKGLFPTWVMSIETTANGRWNPTAWSVSDLKGI
jgi:hypothetical protein